MQCFKVAHFCFEEVLLKTCCHQSQTKRLHAYRKKVGTRGATIMKNKNVGTIKIGGINESGEEERREEKK